MQMRTNRLGPHGPRSACGGAWARLLAAVAVLALGAVETQASEARFDVGYRSATTVYLGAGSADGLAVGDRLRVVEGQSVVAELEVVYAAEHSASTRVVNEQRPVRPGDAAVRASSEFAANAEKPQAPAAEPAAAAPAAAATPTPSKPWARARGGIALGYYNTVDRTSSQLDFQQRTMRVNLGLSEIGGRPLSLVVRLTSNQDNRARAVGPFAPKSESDNRLYEAALRYEARSGRLAIEAGRIGASYFSGIGYLDGGSIRVQALPRLQLGGFFGRRADVYGLGFDGNGLKYGGFLRVAPSRSSVSRVDALLAFVHEESGGEISREYVSLETRLYAGNRLSFFERAELDWNRGWRAALASSEVQISNLSLSALWRMSSFRTLTLSYDGRRNYRTYVNRQTPAELFDDLLHQGLGANLMLAGAGGARFTLGGTARLVAGGAPAAYSASIGIAHDRIGSGRASLGLDASGYRNEFTEGLLLVARMGRRFGRTLSFDLSGGASPYRMRVSATRRISEWVRLTARGELGHGLYLLGDADYNFGDDARGPRSFVELGYRF
jgi:hypothetical protein